MKVLWIVNTIFPYPASKLLIKKECFGGWLNGLANSLRNNKEIELAVATVYDGKIIKKFYDGEFWYFLIPGASAIKYNYKLEKYWKIIQNEFNPDIVHIHGTEFSHGLAFINACPDVKSITSIQGLVSVCERVYFGNIPEKTIRKNITLRDLMKRDNLFQQKKKFFNRGRNEIELIKKSNAIIGRTEWDFSNTKAISSDEKYFHGNETLRQIFYEDKWDIKNIERHSIFTSQGTYPIKGLHYLLEAVYLLKRKYPDIKLYIAGNNITDTSTIKNKLKLTGYGKIIKSIIKKYDLKKQIVFTGVLDEKEMLKKYLNSNVFVLPSVIENSSNSLGEAMIIGIPCIASNTGGTMDILEHKKEGFLYPYTEPAMCADYISRFFEDDQLCKNYGEQARRKALERHSPDKNAKRIIEIYKNVIGAKK